MEGTQMCRRIPTAAMHLFLPCTWSWRGVQVLDGDMHISERIGWQPIASTLDWHCLFRERHSQGAMQAPS